MLTNSAKSKNKNNKIMNWIKKSIRNKRKKKNNKNNCNSDQSGDMSPTTPTTPSDELPSLRLTNTYNSNKFNKKLPALKAWKSTPTPLTKYNAEQKENSSSSSNSNISHTEIDINEPNELWMILNEDNECDPAKMFAESLHKNCLSSACQCCMRLKFVAKYCHKYINSDGNNSNSDNNGLVYNNLTTFMSSLDGYSTVQLSRDFKHAKIYHYKVANGTSVPDDNNNNGVPDAKSLVTEIISFLNLNMNMNYGQITNNHNKPKSISKSAHVHDHHDDDNILIRVSKLMMQFLTIKEFNLKYMKVQQLNKGANGVIYAVRNWRNRKFYGMKEICFKHLNINILYELLRNWLMVQKLKLIHNDTNIELYIDTKKSLFLIVQHLYKGSMCDLLKSTYFNKKRCLNEIELKNILKNGVLGTLNKLHCNGYIHGDIKPENIVYERIPARNPDINKPASLSINTAIIDYDLCTKYDPCNDNDQSTPPTTTYAEWRGTLGYSPPEWIPSRHIKSEITSKVDIFSLGLTLLILLRGEQPFLCPTAYKIKLKKVNPDIDIKKLLYDTMINNGEGMISRFLNQLLVSKQITSDLYDLLNKMLQFNPNNRCNIQQIINHQWITK